MKNRIIAIFQILINIGFIPMYFIKLFHEVSILPGYDSNGNFITSRSNHYYSAYQNLLASSSYSLFLNLSFALIGVSITLSILNFIIFNNKKLKSANYIGFTCSLFAFVVAMLFASTVYRCY